LKGHINERAFSKIISLLESGQFLTVDNEQERPHQSYIITSTGGIYTFLVWALLIIQSRAVQNS